MRTIVSMFLAGDFIKVIKYSEDGFCNFIRESEEECDRIIEDVQKNPIKYLKDPYLNSYAIFLIKNKETKK